MMVRRYYRVTSATRVSIFQYEILLNYIPTIQTNIEPRQVEKMGEFYELKIFQIL